jgi:hypothetical protein
MPQSTKGGLQPTHQPTTQFDEENQNYYHAIARDEKEAGELIDNGWTYILTTPQKIMMFRKRK